MTPGEYGVFEPYVTIAGQIMAAALALTAAFTGKGVWAPATPGLPGYATRVFGAASAIGLVVLHVRSRAVLDAPDFAWLALWLVIAGLVAATLYYYLRQKHVFTCAGDPRLYIDARQTNRNAQSVLDGKLDGLPEQYANISPPLPVHAREYFCESGMDPYFIWEPGAIARVNLLIFLAYGLFIVPMTLALASGAIALSQLPAQETPRQAIVVLPADVLFDFDKAAIKPDAEAALTRLAAELRARNVKQIRIEGHTDARGTPDYNQGLSERRAQAVAQFLAQRGGLGQVRMSPVGLGARQPVAPNETSPGVDDPGGRAKNRRVTIIAEK